MPAAIVQQLRCAIDPDGIDALLTYLSGQDIGDVPDPELDPLVLDLLQGSRDGEVVYRFVAGNCNATYTVRWLKGSNVEFMLKLQRKRRSRGPLPCLGHLVTIKHVAGTGSMVPKVSRSGMTASWSRIVLASQLELDSPGFCASISMDPCVHEVENALNNTTLLQVAASKTATLLPLGSSLTERSFFV